MDGAVDTSVGSGTMFDSPELPPVVMPWTLPESPVPQVTASGAIRSVTVMLQSPVAPDVGVSTADPPVPLSAWIPVVGVGSPGDEAAVPAGVAADPAAADAGATGGTSEESIDR